jgi:hypothetical protein
LQNNNSPKFDNKSFRVYNRILNSKETEHKMTTEQQRLERIMREALEDCAGFAGGLTAEQKAVLEQYFFG